MVSELNRLLRLGHFFALDFIVNTPSITSELAAFESDWVQYNPYKPQVARQGLSVTSLDGQMGGKPDLYSLSELYRREGVRYRESDFRTPTKVYKGCPSLHPLFEHFGPYLGRTHFLRFNAGGYFPPHRDGVMAEETDTFRILVPVLNVCHSNVAFLLDGRRLNLKNGDVYFINTLLAHSVFAFCDNVVLLVCNVILRPESVDRVYAKVLEAPL